MVSLESAHRTNVAVFDRLLKAEIYSRDVHQSVWAFAVEIDELRKLGLNDITSTSLSPQVCSITPLRPPKLVMTAADFLVHGKWPSRIDPASC